MLLALALAAVHVAGTVAGPVYAPETPASTFGVNASFYRAAPGDAGPMLSAISAGGLGTVREGRGGNWSVVEPNPPAGGVHRYAWATPDRVEADLAAHGLRWYAYIGLTPRWDSAVIGGPPKDAAAVGDFAAYARAFAQRYGRGGAFWKAHPELPYLPVTDYELANEPNGPAGRQAGWTPAKLAAITAAGQEAIKSADPSATVIPAAFSQLGDPATDGQDAGSWVASMLKHSRGLNLDAIGINLYRGAGGSNSVPAFETTLRGVRAELQAAGAGQVPIDIDEIGWVTQPNRYGVTAISEGQRAQNLTEIVSRWPQSNCDIRKILPFIWSSGIGNPGEVPPGFELFGGDHGDEPNQAGSAYTWAVQRATGHGLLPPWRAWADIC
jgi:hypothetical protein